MRLQNIIFKNTKWLSLFVLLFCFCLNSQVFAQSDRESVIQERESLEISKSIKSPTLKQETSEEENSYAPKNSSGTDHSSLKANRSSYSEDGASVEEKKEDKTPVSFNIFLYVLDRFKEN